MTNGKDTQEKRELLVKNASAAALTRVQCLLLELLVAKIEGASTPKDMEDTVSYLNARIMELINEYRA